GTARACGGALRTRSSPLTRSRTRSGICSRRSAVRQTADNLGDLLLNRQAGGRAVHGPEELPALRRTDRRRSPAGSLSRVPPDRGVEVREADARDAPDVSVLPESARRRRTILRV